MAAILGNGRLSDAFLFAFLFPNYFRAIFGEGTINPAFLPRYAALHARGGHAAAAISPTGYFPGRWRRKRSFWCWRYLGMPLIVAVFVPGYTPEQQALTASLARITFPYLILTVVAIQLSAMLNAIERFWAAAAWSNLLNLAMIAHASGVALVSQCRICRRLGRGAGRRGATGLHAVGGRAGRPAAAPRRLVWTPEIKEFFKAYGVVTFGAASVVVAPLIDFFIASYLPTGSRTALYYADRINQLPLGVLGIALGTVLLPEMSTRLAKGDRAGSDAAQNRSAALTLLLTLPFAVAFLAIPGTIMRAIFAHGAFRLGRGVAVGAGAGRLWRGASRHGAGADRGFHLLCPSRHHDAGARHGDRHRPQHRTQGSVRLGIASGRGGRGAGHGAGRLDQCRRSSPGSAEAARCLPSRPNSCGRCRRCFWRPSPRARALG